MCEIGGPLHMKQTPPLLQNVTGNPGLCVSVGVFVYECLISGHHLNFSIYIMQSKGINYRTLAILHVSKQTWWNMTDDKWGVCCIVTFSESKQAMTRPFSTWQLREGWANLHSASDLEQVPLWNSRHTSRVSHLVSRPMVMLTAIRDARKTLNSSGRWTEKLSDECKGD